MLPFGQTNLKSGRNQAWRLQRGTLWSAENEWVYSV